MESLVNKIILGTVKLGIPDYGFSSEKNSINPFSFLNEVVNCGIKSFDTSPRYQDSEKIIGEYIFKTKHQLLIDTKIDNLLPNDKNSPRKILESVKTSLKSLDINKINTIYIHQNDYEIISDEYIKEGLEILKNSNLVTNIGISVYNYKEIEYGLMSNLYNVIQLPINIIDLSYYHRYIKNNNQNIKFNARSIFLQGFLLNYKSNKIKDGDIIIKYIQHLESESKKNGFNVIDLIKYIIFNLDGIDRFIIGSTNIKNIKNNISETDLNIPNYLIEEVFEFSRYSKSYSNPRNW